MSLPLILTKFNLPLLGPKVVQRPRLLRLLDNGLEQNASLFLVCGPAGYGKTTIVSEWLRTSRGIHPDQTAWLNLEREDDDITRFLVYFVTALQRNHPGFGEAVLKLLRTHKPQPVHVLAALLVNELSEFTDRMILVLDDYHLITAESIQGFITFLVDHQPPQLCLVLVTRADPSLPLARLRAKGQLVELRQNELCFLPKEVKEFTNQTLDLELSPEQVIVLTKQTEGWISGLQLAAISMRDLDNPSAFLKDFSGEHEFIADYLTAEVLARLPETIRTFLLQTSILERLTAPLCEMVTGNEEAQELLEQLVADNLFIIRLDNQQTWYRYHNLFADLLRKRLQTTQPAIVNELHNLASKWYEQNDLLNIAIEHAILGSNTERTCRLIEQVAENMMMHGETATLLRWLESLPENAIMSRPPLGCLYGAVLILGGRSQQVVASLLEKMSRSADLSEFQGEINMLQALLAIHQGNAGSAIQLSEAALQQLSPRYQFFRSLAADTLGMGYTLAGNIPAAVLAFEQVVEISSQTGNDMMALMALTNLSGLHYLQGELRTAVSICQETLELISQRIGRQAPIFGKTLFNLGEMLREQGDLDTALKYLLEACSMMENFGEIGLPVAYLAVARIKMNLRDGSAAQSYIDKARRQAKASSTALMSDRLVDVMQVRYWINRGELEQAAQWVRVRGFVDRSPAEIFAEAAHNMAINELFQAEYLTLIRLLLAKRQPDRAIEAITVLQELVERKRYQRRVLDILILKALALHQKGDIDLALQALGKALSIAEPEGYQRIFIDEGEPVAQLLYQAVVRGISPSYAGKLLNAFSEDFQTSESSGELPSESLIEPLSKREMEVLDLMTNGLSNAEIAVQLCISLSTVKGHTTNIFGKLCVKNRTGAINRARSLGLLAPP